jgi:hypothetical protein
MACCVGAASVPRQGMRTHWGTRAPVGHPPVAMPVVGPAPFYPVLSALCREGCALRPRPVGRGVRPP